jgi:hypothetical protein
VRESVHENNGRLKAENPFLDGDKNRIKVPVYEHEVELFRLTIEERIKQERIKVPEKREKPVLRPASAPKNKGVNHQNACPVSQKEQLKSGHFRCEERMSTPTSTKYAFVGIIGKTIAQVMPAPGGHA